MYHIKTTPRFERELKALVVKHPQLDNLYARALFILANDPHNQSGQYPILKLVNIHAGEGQYRLRLRRFRIRYDIVEKIVVLKAAQLRRENTYG